MDAKIASLYRHPVKGFTPERLSSARLEAGACFPCDRLYAVEDGPGGPLVDPLSKMRFTVLAKIPAVARVRTAYDDASGVLSARAQGHADFVGDLRSEEGRAGFEAWLTAFLGEQARGPLRLVEGVGGDRFMDSRSGFVSIVNLASVRDLSRRIGRDLDPLRFRANLYVEGWPAWVENDWTGRRLSVGGATVEVLKPIVRCAATHVDPHTGERDLDLVQALFDLYGHVFCGIYLTVTQGGVVTEGDAAAPV